MNNAPSTSTTTRGIAIALVEATREGVFSKKLLGQLISELEGAAMGMEVQADEALTAQGLMRKRGALLADLFDALEHETKERLK